MISLVFRSLEGSHKKIARSYKARHTNLPKCLCMLVNYVANGSIRARRQFMSETQCSMV